MSKDISSSADWKGRVLGALVGSMITLVGTIIGAGVLYKTESRMMDVRLMELGVGILQDDPTRENRPLRVWGARLLNEYSDVKLPNKLRALLVDSIALPRSAEIRGDGEVRALREGETLIIARVDGVADTAVVEVRSDTTSQDTTP